MTRALADYGIWIGATLAGLTVGAMLQNASLAEGAGPPTPAARDEAKTPLYRSSVVGTDFDFITNTDSSAFDKLAFARFEAFEMPDKRAHDRPLVRDAYIFKAYFRDGTAIDVAVDAAFGSRHAAQDEAMRYAGPLGRLPRLYRRALRHVVVHQGGVDTTAFAEDRGHFFVVYSDNATKRIGSHDLEETVFHEATHAAIQEQFLSSEGWKTAKARDDAYITHYAQTQDQEDFAESALFAYTLITHPERLPDADRVRVERQIPNRVAFFRRIFAS